MKFSLNIVDLVSSQINKYRLKVVVFRLVACTGTISNCASPLCCRRADEGGVFRSKRSTRYTADEIQDSWETKTDLPVDQRRAEEVEVYGSV